MGGDNSVGKKSPQARRQARETGRPTVFVGRPSRKGSGEGWTSTLSLLILVNIVVTHVTEIVDTPSSTIVPGADMSVHVSFPRA